VRLLQHAPDLTTDPTPLPAVAPEPPPPPPCLAGADAAADLFVAADVFVYIGDLGPVFKAAQDCASPR
jgi:hypothetical protein